MNRRLMVAVVVVFGLAAFACGKVQPKAELTPKATATVAIAKPACEPSLTAVCLKDGSKLSIGDKVDESKFSCKAPDGGITMCEALDQNGPQGNIFAYTDGKAITTLVVINAGEEPKERSYFPKVHFEDTLQQATQALPGSKPSVVNGIPVLEVRQESMSVYYLFEPCRRFNVRADQSDYPNSPLYGAVISGSGQPSVDTLVTKTDCR